MVNGKRKFRPYGREMPARNFGLMGTNNIYNYAFEFPSNVFYI